MKANVEVHAHKKLGRSIIFVGLLMYLFACVFFLFPASSLAAETISDLSTSNAALAEAPIADEIELKKADFGVVTNRVGPTKDWKLHPIVVVPNLPGVQYAWKLKTSKMGPVFVREEFLLRYAPSMWRIREKAGEGSSQLLNGGPECILESFQPTDDGWLGHAWTVSPGDPSGPYRIKIWLNGKLFHTFTFNVGDAPRIGREIRTY